MNDHLDFRGNTGPDARVRILVAVRFGLLVLANRLFRKTGFLQQSSDFLGRLSPK